jgi:hypothetical protein
VRIRSALRTATAVAFSASLALVLAVPVAATIYSNDVYSGDYAFSYSCGSDTIEVSGLYGGREIIRTGKGSQQTAFFDHNQYWASETHTNLTTGESISISANGLFQETRAVPLGGTRFMFSSVNAGQPFTVRDAQGNLILRDSGAIKEVVVFDTQGDSVPGGIFIESVSVSIAGPHPGLDFDTCSVLG